MKLPITCMTCGFPQDGSAPDFTLYKVPVREDHIYELICRRGHKTVTILQEQKFEVLFEIAVSAIADGYYREAVASATSSLERFYEFFCRVYFAQQKTPEAVVEESWRHVKNQSERQLGLYVAAYTLQFGTAPDLVSNERSNFRNEVIHKGRIPTKAEAIAYANMVLGLMIPIVLKMKKHMADAVETVSFKSHMARHVSVKGPHATMSWGPTFRMVVSHTEPHPITIDEQLKKMEAQRFFTPE